MNSSLEDTNKEFSMDELKATIATVRKNVWKAQFVIWVIRPVHYVLQLAWCGVLLYAGTWIVVLALKHSGVIR